MSADVAVLKAAGPRRSECSWFGLFLLAKPNSFPMRYNLSEVNGVIRDRRSIKPEKFSDRAVHRELVEVLLENARWAPTHALTQPWYFKVFMGDGRNKLATFQSDAYKAATPEAEFKQAKFDKLLARPSRASVIIAICMKRQETEKIPEVEEIAAVACAAQNMQLTAAAYGLGAYWTSGGMTYTDEMKGFLGLGEKDRCLGFLYLGYPEGEWPKGQRRPQEYFSDWVTE